jgi:flagellar hook-associated protein 2
MGTTALTPLTLSGVSTYSSDFQNILNRATQIAQIPITFLQNQDATVLSQGTALSGIETAVSNLGDSLTALGTLAQGQALSATSSDTAAVTATATGATTAASYTINSVKTIATAASERTTSGFADSSTTPVSTTGSLNLVVGSKNYDFTLTNNSLVGLRDQINSLGAGVNASILTTSGGNYLSLTANTTGATTLQLFDDPTGANTNLLTDTNQGSSAEYYLNGIDVKQASNVANNVIPGVSFTLVAPTTTPTTISLASDPTQLSSALQNFVTNYNSLTTALQAQEGTAGGPLAGDTVVTQLQDLQRQISTYTGSTGSIKTLADLGIEFSDTGVASLNQTTFDALSPTQISDAFSYLGSATSGLAGLAASVQEFSDPLTGLIQAEQAGFTQTDKDLQSQIATLTDRANLAQTNLQAQLAKADAAVAALQSTQNTITASLQGLSLVLYGQNPQVA